MEQIISLFGVDVFTAHGRWVLVTVYSVLFLVVAVAGHRLLIQYLHRLAKKSSVTWDDELVGSVRAPTRFVFLAMAVAGVFQYSGMPMRDYPAIGHSVKIVIVISLFWALERSLATLIRANVIMKSLTNSSRHMVSIILRIAIFSVAMLMVLDSVGISITPILASLGVGSVAVALALQDTLSNFFSGIYILADQPFGVGDYVELEGGVHGYVSKIGWRSTHIRQLSNNIVVVPNAKVASSALTNFDLLDRETALVIPVGVDYSSDLEKVERVTIEVARETLERVQGGVTNFTPFIRYSEFADSSINFSVILRAQKYDDHFLVKHEFIKALHKRYGQEKIEIPFPQRVVHMRS